MKLKKFMYINIILSLILIGSIYTISKVTKEYIQNDLYKFKSYLSRKNNSIKLVNLGTSHGKYGIFYLKNDYLKMNLARDNQSFYYDLKLLKKYNKKIEKNATIVIPISIFSFYSHYKESINKNYIQLLKRKDVLGINLSKYYLMKHFLILYPPSNILTIIKNNKKSKVIRNLVIYPEDLKYEQRKKESLETVEVHLGIIEKAYSIKNAEEDFIKLIDYIESKNWNYVLITTPFSYLYNENIEKYQKRAFQKRIYDNLREVEEKLGKKFVYLDYSHDSRFENNLEYFFDDDHLNEKGAKYFTEILLKDLKKLGYKID